MKFLMDFSQPLVGHVGVHLCGRDIFVAQQFLHAA